jgi:GT2 family glycosyltransferase
MKDILILIPIYNCYHLFKKMVPILKNYDFDILIIDDGSDFIPKNFLRNNGIKLLSHRKNKGKGAALKTGFKYAIEHNYKGVFTLDGDFQHHPDDISKFLSSPDSYDLLVGKRNFNKQSMPIHRKLSNYLTSKILSSILKVKIEDSQSGFRFIKTRLIKDIELKSDNFDLETELLVKAAHNNYKIGFIPIRTIYNNSSSNIKGFIDTFRFLKVVIKYGFKK